MFFYLTHFDAVSSYLNLSIYPSDEFDNTFGKKFSKVAWFIHSFAFTEWDREKPFCCDIRKVFISPGDTIACNIQFANYSDRNRFHSLVENIYPYVIPRNTYRHWNPFISVRIILMYHTSDHSLCRAIFIQYLYLSIKLIVHSLSNLSFQILPANNKPFKFWSANINSVEDLQMSGS